MRAGTSASELACRVPAPPSWPVFRAASSSRISAPRHSPSTSRSGRIRSASRTSRSRPSRPAPSRFACRASSETKCGCSTRSSATSSMATMRSLGDAAPSIAPSRVVLPLPLAPLIRRFLRAAMSPRPRCRAAPVRRIPRASSSARPSRRDTAASGSRAGCPCVEMGGSTACTRMPSCSRTSTHGVASSMWRPPSAMSRTASARSPASSSPVGGRRSSPLPAIHPQLVRTVREDIRDSGFGDERREFGKVAEVCPPYRREGRGIRGSESSTGSGSRSGSGPVGVWREAGARATKRPPVVSNDDIARG